MKNNPRDHDLCALHYPGSLVPRSVSGSILPRLGRILPRKPGVARDCSQVQSNVRPTTCTAHRRIPEILTFPARYGRCGAEEKSVVLSRCKHSGLRTRTSQTCRARPHAERLSSKQGSPGAQLANYTVLEVIMYNRTVLIVSIAEFSRF